MSLYKIVKNVP